MCSNTSSFHGTCKALLDCLVVGAGPVGLLLASELRLADR